jgi:hypothetical protein
MEHAKPNLLRELERREPQGRQGTHRPPRPRSCRRPAPPPPPWLQPSGQSRFPATRRRDTSRVESPWGRGLGECVDTTLGASAPSSVQPRRCAAVVRHVSFPRGWRTRKKAGQERAHSRECTVTRPALNGPADSVLLQPYPGRRRGFITRSSKVAGTARQICTAEVRLVLQQHHNE